MTTLHAPVPTDILDEWSSSDDLLAARQPLYYFWAKRFLDIVIASTLIVALFPLLLLVAVLIRLDSSGPAIFIQERAGSRRIYQNGQHRWVPQTFRIYKFRSMAADTDPSVHQQHIQAYVAASSGGGVSGSSVPLKAPLSVTRVGRFIRKTSIDELPQLFNVIKGDMSLVGPRPVPTYEVEEYRPHHYERFGALPGITGFWQVRGRCSTTFEEQMSMDAHYVRNQGLLLDLIILIQTIPAVISGRGAA
jgi:lipopolysaccharide/colanic/teichoic acid biosynthesis glycosyltransferase